MTERQWETFFGLLKLAVNGEKPWEDKADELMRQARRCGAETELEELATWVEM